ncbi:MAG: hypothetical protein ACYDH0_05515 [Candidatus Aminicenantales bacterium]
MRKMNSNQGSLAKGAGVLLVLMTATGLVAGQKGQGVLSKLGVDEASAESGVFLALTSDYFYEAAAFKAFKALPAQARADVVTAGLGWAKGYAGSAEFKEAYRKLRESRKPQAPQPVSSADESMAKIKAELEKSIESMRQIQATADAEMKESMEEAIRQMRSQISEMDRNPQMKESLRMGAEMEEASKKGNYEADLKSWNEDLPEDSGKLIARRIREFLAASADVDYGAKLTPRNDRMIFVNPAYEAKPAHWKTCFRAGKEATEAARVFARAWLAELEKR